MDAPYALFLASWVALLVLLLRSWSERAALRRAAERAHRKLRLAEIEIQSLRSSVALWRNLARAYAAGSSGSRADGPGFAAGLSWWDVLGVAPDAPFATIKAAYRRLAKTYHPDTPGTGDLRKMQALNRAYATAQALHRHSAAA